MRTLVERAVQSAARRLGYRLESYKKAPYGLDPWRDLERLAGEWQVELATAFDVGANIGQTAELLKKLWPAMRIVCFEPTPDTFAKLQKSISGLRDVTAENIGLGASAGSFDLFTYPEDPLLNSLAPNSPYIARFSSQYDTKMKKVTCMVRTLDEVRHERGIERINLLKIDTEGFDLQVLEGARQSLSEGRIDFIYLEFNTVHPKDGATGGALAPLDAFLTPYGFHLVSAYTDWLSTSGEFFSSFNALFARPRS